MLHAVSPPPLPTKAHDGLWPRYQLCGPYTSSSSSTRQRNVRHSADALLHTNPASYVDHAGFTKHQESCLKQTRPVETTATVAH
jgi:hypothetical protein